MKRLIRFKIWTKDKKEEKDIIIFQWEPDSSLLVDDNTYATLELIEE